MRADGSCPTCGATSVGRDEFTYAHEGEALSGLTCMATCRECGGVWIEVYRLERIITEAGSAAEEPSPTNEAPRADAAARAKAPLARRRAAR